MPEQSRHQSDYLAKILGGYQWTEANDGWAQANGTLTSLQGLTRDVEQFRKENAELRAEVERLSSGRHTINIAGTSPDSAHTVTVPCVRMAEVEQRRAQLASARIELGKAAEQIVALRAESERLRAGIEQIRDASGMACRHMETCNHKGCNGSISAHLIALELLNGHATGRR